MKEIKVKRQGLEKFLGMCIHNSKKYLSSLLKILVRPPKKGQKKNSLKRKKRTNEYKKGDFKRFVRVPFAK